MAARLPTAIQAFIPAHHGTMLPIYHQAHQRALEPNEAGVTRAIVDQIFATMALFPSRGKRGL